VSLVVPGLGRGFECRVERATNGESRPAAQVEIVVVPSALVLASTSIRGREAAP
jgi:hypothetical protein